MITWFRNILVAITTVAHGMYVTLRYWLVTYREGRGAFTQKFEYPERPVPVAARNEPAEAGAVAGAGEEKSSGVNADITEKVASEPESKPAQAPEAVPVIKEPVEEKPEVKSMDPEAREPEAGRPEVQKGESKVSEKGDENAE